MLKSYKNWLLFLILSVGLFLRTINLNVSPPGFNADEASLGYNAYSILKTGKDEWGESFPIVFKSFSDYKPGLYVYLSIPGIAIFGLNETTTRLPSIILGSLSILLIFLLARELFADEIIAFSSAFLLAVSPWHIFFSRAAWETNVATFFILLGVLSFLRAVKYGKNLLIPALSFVASMYTYQSPRLVVPLLVASLSLFYRQKVFTKRIWAVILVSLFLIIPFAGLLVNNQGLERFQGVSIFSDTGPTVQNDQVRGDYENPNSLGAKIYHNRQTTYGLNFLEHYLDHFSPDFLFIKGDPIGRNGVPGMGQMYPFEIITLIVGVYFLINKKYKDGKVVWIWLLISPIAASLTFQTPQAIRAENEVIPLVLISGLGLGWFIKLIIQKKGWLKYGAALASLLLVVFFVGRFTDEYFIHLPKQRAKDWQSGYSQAVKLVSERQDSYKKIVISDKLGQPYIFFLFYTEYNPEKYRLSAVHSSTDRFGFGTTRAFDKFEFKSINKEEIEKGKNTLFVIENDDDTGFKLVGT